MELKGPFRKEDGQYEAQIQISNFKWPLTYDQVWGFRDNTIESILKYNLNLKQSRSDAGSKGKGRSSFRGRGGTVQDQRSLPW